MDPERAGQLEKDGHGGDDLLDHKGTNTFGRQFQRGTLVESHALSPTE